MNIPKPMAHTTFKKHSVAWGKVITDTAEESMSNAGVQATTSDLAMTRDRAWPT